MKVFHVVMMLVIFTAVGVFGHVFTQKEPIDREWQAQVELSFEKMVTINAQINEAALKNRFGLELNYDQLTLLTKNFYDTLEKIENLLKQKGKIDGDLGQAFQGIKKAFVNKGDILERFKSHNSILRNSVFYAPVAGEKLLKLVEKDDGLKAYTTILKEIIDGLLSYTLLGNDDDTKKNSFFIK